MGIEKKVDMPPTGRRNPDPITNAAGAHPIETGVGAALVGAAAGVAAGAAGGPVTAGIGAVVGAVAGGYAGKGVGEMIDPTTEDTWLRDNFKSRPYVQDGEKFETYQPAYRYGAEVEARAGDDDFERMEPELESGWLNTSDRARASIPWERARGAVKDAYDRCVHLRKNCPSTPGSSGSKPVA